MNVEQFKASVEQEGFETVTKSMQPGTQVARHSHDFDVKALVLEGAITLRVDGVATTYAKGDVFSMAAGCEHEEDVGAGGVSYLVGRRKAAS